MTDIVDLAAALHKLLHKYNNIVASNWYSKYQREVKWYMLGKSKIYKMSYKTAF